MIELVQLERRHSEFDGRNVRIIAVSMDNLEDSAKTQSQYPHLMIVSDEAAGLTKAVGVLHEHANPEGGDAAAPTTILIDANGIVRWIFRPDGVIRRLSPDELLDAVDEHLKQRS